MITYGVETDDSRYGPAVVFHVQAENLLTAWIRAHWYAPPGRRVMVVFVDDAAPYRQATRLDYSSTSGSGDPH